MCEKGTVAATLKVASLAAPGRAGLHMHLTSALFKDCDASMVRGYQNPWQPMPITQHACG